jgi:hypothetical protein
MSTLPLDRQRSQHLGAGHGHGLPTLQPPNIGVALAVSNATAATQQTSPPTQPGNTISRR